MESVSGGTRSVISQSQKTWLERSDEIPNPIRTGFNDMTSYDWPTLAVVSSRYHGNCDAKSPAAALVATAAVAVEVAVM